MNIRTIAVFNRYFLSNLISSKQSIPGVKLPTMSGWCGVSGETAVGRPGIGAKDGGKVFLIGHSRKIDRSPTLHYCTVGPEQELVFSERRIWLKQNTAV